MRPRFASLVALLLVAPLLATPSPLAADEVGANDFRLSTMGPDGDPDYRASAPAIAYNPLADRYLVVWSGDDDTGLLVEGENEIHGQLIVGATGAMVGPDDPLISATGGLGDPAFAALTPDVVYNSVENEFLVVWVADTDEGALVGGEYEVWGQIVNANLIDVGSNFRISFMGPDGAPAWGAEYPAAAYNPARNEYLVVWSGDTNSGGLVLDEQEIWAQRLSANGTLVGGNFRVSDMGGTGDPDYDAFRPDVVFNTRQLEYLVVWYGDDNTAPLVDHEFEVYGQRMDELGGGLGAIVITVSFQVVYLVDPPLVPPALEWEGEPSLDDTYSQLVAQHAGPQGQNVRVIVPPGHLGHEFITAESGPDALYLVCRYRRADTGAAYNNGAIGLAVLDFRACLCDIIRIIARFFGVRSDIVEL